MSSCFKLLVKVRSVMPCVNTVTMLRSFRDFEQAYRITFAKYNAFNSFALMAAVRHFVQSQQNKE